MLLTLLRVLLAMLLVDVPAVELLKMRLLLLTGTVFSAHWAAVFQDPVVVFQVELPEDPA